MERRRRTAAREGKAGRGDARCTRRLRACSHGNGVHNDEHVGVHYYMILWLHGEVEEDGSRLCASLTGERLGLELVTVESSTATISAGTEQSFAVVQLNMKRGPKEGEESMK